MVKGRFKLDKHRHVPVKVYIIKENLKLLDEQSEKQNITRSAVINEILSKYYNNLK